MYDEAKAASDLIFHLIWLAAGVGTVGIICGTITYYNVMDNRRLIDTNKHVLRYKAELARLEQKLLEGSEG